MSSPAAFPNTHAALRGRICRQWRCYSDRKTLIPLPRLILTSRVSSDDSGVPAASGAAEHQGCALQKPRGFFRPRKGLVSRAPAGITRVRGSPASRGHGHRRLCAPQRAAGPPRIPGKIPFRSCLCSASTEHVNCPKSTALLPLLAWGLEPGSSPNSVFASLTPV